MAYFDEIKCEIIFEDEDREVKNLINEPLKNEIMDSVYKNFKNPLRD